MSTATNADPHSSNAAADSTSTLRRVENDRIVAGVAAGLGRYFTVDPVLFRVLFAVLTLFGGTGLVVYGLGWLVIPEEHTASSDFDRVLAGFRRRHIPFGLGVAAAVVACWLAVFSWWAPGEVTSAVIAASVLIVMLSRFHREPVQGGTLAPSAEKPATGPVGRGHRDAGQRLSAGIDRWLATSRERRRRSRPLFLLTLALAVIATVAVYVADAVTGVRMDAYFLAPGAVVVTGLLLGLALRRPAWTLIPALLPLAAGLAVFAGSATSLNDGVGQRTWTPTAASELRGIYRSGLGQSTLDLRQLPRPDTTRTTDIELGAGEVRLLVPRTLAVQVEASIRFGDVAVNGRSLADGTSVTQTVLTPGAQSAPTAPRLRIAVHLRAGTVRITYF